MDVNVGVGVFVGVEVAVGVAVRSATGHLPSELREATCPILPLEQPVQYRLELSSVAQIAYLVPPESDIYR